MEINNVFKTYIPNNITIKFGEDYGEVPDPRENNPMFASGEKIMISPKKTNRRKNSTKKAFVIP